MISKPNPNAKIRSKINQTVEHPPSALAKCFTKEKFVNMETGQVYSRNEFINLRNRETVINMQPTSSTIMTTDTLSDNNSTDTYTVIN